MKELKRPVSLAFAVLTIFSGSASAETGSPVLITEIRPYMGTNVTTFTAAEVTTCGTKTFRINGIDTPSGKAALAAVYTAIATGSKVKIEVTNCTGWGSNIQSIYLTNQK